MKNRDTSRKFELGAWLELNLTPKGYHFKQKITAARTAQF